MTQSGHWRFDEKLFWKWWNAGKPSPWMPGGSIDTETIDDPVLAFIYGAKGLMYNLTFEGTKVSPINPK